MYVSDTALQQMENGALCIANGEVTLVQGVGFQSEKDTEVNKTPIIE